ncbi:sensor histidine kinase [Cohnella cholangitidis]|uniref:HAMP domain-containing protein n=1 Tax=Cohnella cholangitidis TaxID=2598458 RepID=A0A7G5C3Y5_9BACL|nr:histidine kinase [Cohnella cholangitidis]QMV43919.1 HAMP domain-containing protein [Cohnella cholangitidis]
MHPRWNTFSKMIIMIILLIMPIVIIYSYTNHTSINVIRQELQDKNLNRLSFFTSQVDNIVEQLSILSIIVSKDPSVKKLGDTDTLPTSYAQLQAQEDLIKKLSLLSVTSSWRNSLIIYLPRVKQSISNDYFSTYDDEYLSSLTEKSWVYHPTPNDQGEGYFSKVLWSPLLVNRSLLEADAVVEVRFYESNMIRMLNDYKNDGQDVHSFFYKQGSRKIEGNVINSEISQEIAGVLDKTPLSKTGYQTIEIGEEQYLVSYVQSKSLGWYTVDYLPLKQVLAPITKSRNLFYGAIGLILLIALMGTVVLYRQVQVPIKLLLKGVQKIQTGSYSHRINFRPRNEFDFLFTKFNEMTDEIQRLLEKVYMENIRFREVKLKHLQSQINPHFLSNSLFFVKNMIAIDDKQAATTMILNLADYFRYITKMEHTLTTLREEIALIDNYLTIQNLRIERFHYEIDIPEPMLDLQIPRLMIQPIVENTIIHGVEKNANYGIIQITGEESDGEYRIIIDDNGGGITDKLLRDLQLKVSEPLDQEQGCGLWNVHQRLFYQYDQHSGLKFENSPLGGLRVIVHWRGPDR